jgi:hypothetical protein
MNFQQKILRVKRILEYGISYYLFEKPRGLDFSKRSRYKKTSLTSTGYALTSKKALKNILNGICYDSKSAFLDVGGGKGGTSVSAIQMGFGFACSLELEEHLHVVAQKNIAILGLRDRIHLEQGNAFEFDQFARFSHIFMLNLLTGDGHRKLVSHIVDSLCRNGQKGGRHILIFYGGISYSMILDGLQIGLSGRGRASLLKEDICPHRGNDIRVFEVDL